MATFVRHALQHALSRQLRAGRMVDLGHPLKKGGKFGAAIGTIAAAS
ncbi:MAG: hypothetical protein H0T80_00095 [Betaproteobacteria bacterium]|nr:hypothetical protein [Betaproteobacteria bacterium]MBA3775640.1 hypothetical protein [Betaproteobacteria bacterium]